jgi:hypothetical protein
MANFHNPVYLDLNQVDEGRQETLTSLRVFDPQTSGINLAYKALQTDLAKQ